MASPWNSNKLWTQDRGQVLWSPEPRSQRALPQGLSDGTDSPLTTLWEEEASRGTRAKRAEEPGVKIPTRGALRGRRRRGLLTCVWGRVHCDSTLEKLCF